MNIKKTIIIICSLLVASPAFAIDYPMIAGITITESTSAADFIIYLFNLGIAVGAFIAVIMVIMAGIEWLTSSGNPGKVESAKGKIVNTLLGVAVLFGCYLILNTINSQLTSVKIDNLNCEHGVVVMVKESETKVKQKCIDSNQSEIKDVIISTKSWNFPNKYLLKAYTYSEPNFKGTITEFDCGKSKCSGDISGAKSIYFVPNNIGIYLYDDVSYKPGAAKGYPLFTTTSIPDLSKKNSFDNFIKSIEIIDPEETEKQIKYLAVVFRDQNYQGRCAFVGHSVIDMNQNTDNGYTDSVGNNTISSIIIAKSNFDQETIHESRGEVILYTKDNCGKSDTDPTKQIKSCHIPIQNVTSGQIDILSFCGGQGFIPGDEVMSFEITGAAGLVLSNSEKYAGNENTNCMYFNKSSLGEGTCFASIQKTPIYTIGGKTPKSFIIIPDN